MQTLLKQLPWIMILIIALSLAGAFYWQLLPIFNPSRDAPAAMANIKPAIPTEAPSKTYNIAEFSLFGNADSKPEATPVEQENLPETNLRLVLTGVSSGAGDKIASALIEGPDKQTDLYKVGDTLPGNASLHTIYDDRVVLNRSGKLENLYFPEVSKGGAQYLAAVARDTDQDNAPKMKTAIPRVTTPAIDPGRKQSIKDRLNAIRQRIRAGQN